MKCSAIAQGGNRCNRPALVGKPHCLMHDPESAELRREASRKGGRNRANAVRAAKLLPEGMGAGELVGRLSRLFVDVASGTLEPKIGTACAAIARTLLDAQAAAAQPAIEDLQEQVEALRAMIERGEHVA